MRPQGPARLDVEAEHEGLLAVAPQLADPIDGGGDLRVRRPAFGRVVGKRGGDPVQVPAQLRRQRRRRRGSAVLIVEAGDAVAAGVGVGLEGRGESVREVGARGALAVGAVERGDRLGARREQEGQRRGSADRQADVAVDVVEDRAAGPVAPALRLVGLDVADDPRAEKALSGGDVRLCFGSDGERSSDGLRLLVPWLERC